MPAHRRGPMVGQYCRECGKPYLAERAKVEKGTSKYCSVRCQRVAARRARPNKGPNYKRPGRAFTLWIEDEEMLARIYARADRDGSVAAAMRTYIEWGIEAEDAP